MQKRKNIKKSHTKKLNTNNSKGFARGSITIYMLLSLVIVLVLMFTVIESARVTATGAKLRGATYMGMDSVFSEYAEPVFETYGVLMLWCKNKEFTNRFENYVNENLEQDDYSLGLGTNLYGAVLSSANLSETVKITDKNGELFRNQVTDYMKNYVLEEAAEEILSKTKIFEQADKVNALMEKINKYQDVFKKVEKAVGEVKESIEKVKEKINEPLTALSKMKTSLAGFTAGDTSALTSFNAALDELKTSKNVLQDRLKSVKERTDTYYEKVHDAEETINSMETDLNINPNEFDSDIYQSVQEEIDDLKAKSGETDFDYYNVEHAGKTADGLKNNLDSFDGLLEKFNEEPTKESAPELLKVIEQYEKTYKELDFSGLEINFDDTKTDTESSGFIDEISGILSNGILEYVAPDSSDKVIELGELPSKTVKYDKNGSEGNLASKAVSKALMSEYVRKLFGNYVNPKSDTPLTYEAEYIISGKKADKSCLRDVISTIIAIRTGCNMISILKDSQKKGECYALAMALVGFTGMPVLIKIMQVVLMGTWALAEAIVDAKLLLKGDKVPIIKNETEWNLSLTNVKNFTGESLEGEGFESGFKYEDYLRIMLIAQNDVEQSFRIMDMIQANMTAKENEDFRIKDCLAEVEILAEYKVPKVFICFGIVREYMESDEDEYTYTIGQKYAY